MVSRQKFTSAAICVIALLLTSPWIGAHAQVFTDFEDGLDGWTAVGDGQFYLEEGTGNPGNAMRIDDDATAVTSGVYLYRITAGDFSQTRKMMLMK